MQSSSSPSTKNKNKILSTAVSSYEETTFLSCSPMHCDSRGQEHNVCKELLAWQQEDYFPNASAVVVTILVAKAAVAHHHHHQTNNKILLTDFTDSTTLVLYEKTMFLSWPPVHWNKLGGIVRTKSFLFAIILDPRIISFRSQRHAKETSCWLTSDYYY